MISIVVYGQKPERPAHLLAGLLSLYGGVGLHMADALLVVGQGTIRFSIEAVTRLEQLMLPRSVLMLADQSAPRKLELSTDTIVVTGTDNRRLRRLLKGRPNPVVTCGTGLRDTITFSSAEGERVLMCIQRELPTVDGKWIEPFEFVVNAHCGIQSALLAAGAAAVCGCDLCSRDTNVGL